MRALTLTLTLTPHAHPHPHTLTLTTHPHPHPHASPSRLTLTLTLTTHHSPPIDAVGGWMPTASRSVGTFFLLIYSGIAAASRRGCPASGGPRHANHHVPNASGGGVCAPSVPCSGSALLATRAGQSHAATPRSAQRAKKDLDLSGALPNISRASAVAASLQRCN